MQEILIQKNNISLAEAGSASRYNLELCVQTFGHQTNPIVLLIYGAAGQGILWDKTLCESLAKEGYFVIRFDNRDTGKSSSFEYDLNPYNLKDMAEDLLVILDHFNAQKAHIIGSSMGGYIAQNLAIYYPERILTLTLMMTTINSLPLRGIRGLCKLPPANSEIIKRISELYLKPRLTFEDRINTLIGIWELFNGDKSKFPYNEWHPLALESYERAKGKNAVRNHRLAVLNSPANRSSELENLDIPTLILHGEEDQIIPIAHAYYNKDTIKNSSLIIIEKMAHLLTSNFRNQVEDNLLKHFLSPSYILNKKNA